MNFTAIDFETATYDRASICQAGIIIVEKCQIIDRIKYLIKPPGNIYHQRNMDIHGIKPEDTEHAEPFDVVWGYIRNYIIRKKIVAHNAAFDIDCLKKALKFYKLGIPPFYAYCTLKIYNCGLEIACAMNGIKLDHHDALSDAEACALLMIKDINRK